MAKPGTSGQTLVELALVLPCFCLGVFMAVQLICYCHDMVELQRMAQVMSDRVSYDSYAASKSYWKFNSLWGNYLLHDVHFSRDVPQPWRPFHGISTVSDSGQFFGINVKTDLFPGAGFSGVLKTVSQQGFAETYLEAPIPSED